MLDLLLNSSLVLGRICQAYCRGHYRQTPQPACSNNSALCKCGSSSWSGGLAFAQPVFIQYCIVPLLSYSKMGCSNTSQPRREELVTRTISKVLSATSVSFYQTHTKPQEELIDLPPSTNSEMLSRGFILISMFVLGSLCSFDFGSESLGQLLAAKRSSDLVQRSLFVELQNAATLRYIYGQSYP